jgi:hypothetical protein
MPQLSSLIEDTDIRDDTISSFIRRPHTDILES